MKKSTRKLVLFIVASALVIAGIVGSFAAESGMDYQSDKYEATFFLNHLQVHLLENGLDVCGGENTLDGENKITGQLCQHLGYAGDDKLGKFEPGKIYKEEIAARNGQDIPIYIRMTVRKYWIDPETGEKVPELSPAFIKLSYGDKDYNDSAWQLSEQESTNEASTYYYTEQLPAGKDSAPLFDKLVVSSKIADDYEITESKNEETGVTTYSYTYKYDGSAFMIKADVQAVQTHNANDAIESQWGAGLVKVQDGKLAVE